MLDNSSLKKTLKKQDFGFFALIDPDLKNDNILDQIIDSINNNNFSAILVGGSSISDSKYHDRLKKIKNSSNKPIILFPGSSDQIGKHADAILFTSLISGRNPKYLIDEQVKGVKLIKEYGLNVIPTGYILLDSGSKTSVETISATTPLNSSDYENVLYHSLAAQYFGMDFVYLENGSGAAKPIDYNLIEYISKNIDIPIIVGGGIQTKEDIKRIKNSGATFVVIGTLLEKNPDSKFISTLLSWLWLITLINLFYF